MVAISKNITMNELSNTWNYKYIFDVKKMNMVDNKTVY